MSGVESFFIVGVSVDHIGIGGRRLGFIGTRWLRLGFLV